MDRIEFKLEGQSIPATTTLKAARHALGILRAVEKEKTGKRPTIPWQVEIFAGFDATVIVFRHPEEVVTTGKIEDAIVEKSGHPSGQ